MCNELHAVWKKSASGSLPGITRYLTGR